MTVTNFPMVTTQLTKLGSSYEMITTDFVLFVFLGNANNTFKVLKLDESVKNESPQSMGIGITAPGTYKTACGKGYWECKPNEPKEITLALPSIDYFQYESANSFFIWDQSSSSFQRIWMSD